MSFILGESRGGGHRSELEDVEVGLPGRLPEGPLRRRLHDGDVLPRAGLGVSHLQPPDQTLLILEGKGKVSLVMILVAIGAIHL